MEHVLQLGVNLMSNSQWYYVVFLPGLIVLYYLMLQRTLYMYYLYAMHVWPVLPLHLHDHLSIELDSNFFL